MSLGPPTLQIGLGSQLVIVSLTVSLSLYWAGNWNCPQSHRTLSKTRTGCRAAELPTIVVAGHNGEQVTQRDSPDMASAQGTFCAFISWLWYCYWSIAPFDSCLCRFCGTPVHTTMPPKQTYLVTPQTQIWTGCAFPCNLWMQNHAPCVILAWVQ
jgi:hypothetical protein